MPVPYTVGRIRPFTKVTVVVYGSNFGSFTATNTQFLYSFIVIVTHCDMLVKPRNYYNIRIRFIFVIKMCFSVRKKEANKNISKNKKDLFCSDFHPFPMIVIKSRISI